MMPSVQKVFYDITHNYVLVTSIISWLTAQLIKFILVLIETKKLSLERFVGSGGMPSAHSATVCCMVVALGKSIGVSSPIFALAVMFAMIVMHDAVGVRLESGKHAKIINILIKKSDINDINNEKDLKELLGHNLMEVIAGAFLGIAVALIVPVF